MSQINFINHQLWRKGGGVFIHQPLDSFINHWRKGGGNSFGGGGALKGNPRAYLSLRGILPFFLLFTCLYRFVFPYFSFIIMFWKYFKKINFFKKINIFFIFLYHFNIFMSKIIFKK